MFSRRKNKRDSFVSFIAAVCAISTLLGCSRLQTNTDGTKLFAAQITQKDGGINYVYQKGN